MSVCLTPAGVKYVTQEFQCMTPAGVMYVSMQDLQESSISMYDSCRSQASPCMTPAGVKYVSMYDPCRSQVCHSRISMHDS